MRAAGIACLGVAVMLAAGCGGGAETSTSAASGAVASQIPDPVGFVGYDRVRVDDAEDASGDEVLLAVLKIKSTTGVKDSTKWEWVSTNPVYADDISRGDTADIPDSAGDAWFAGDLTPTEMAWLQFDLDDNTLQADVLVTIAFVFEADNGNASDDVGLLQRVMSPLIDQVANIVEGAQIPADRESRENPAESQKALGALVDSLKKISPTLSTSEILLLLGRFAKAAGDPNDVVGVASTVFVPVGATFEEDMAYLGIKPKDLGLFGPGEGDGKQAWTSNVVWRVQEDVKVGPVNLGRADMTGEVWYGFMSPTWVEDWMKVESSFPWQGKTVYWLKVSAAMRQP